MKELFVTEEQALALKELGFKEPCICVYNVFGVLKTNIGGRNPEDEDYPVVERRPRPQTPAPTWQQAADFLFRKYGIRTTYLWNPDLRAKTFDSLISRIHENETPKESTKTL